MLYISREGEVMSSDNSLKSAMNLYDEWLSGKSAFVLSTSGSTGTPKPITLHREAILASIQATQEAFGLTSEDFFLCNLNTDFIGGRMMLFRAAEIQCDLVVVAPTSNPFETLAQQTYHFSSNWGKNFFSFVPLQLQNVLEKEQHIQLLRTAKAILVGGGAVSLAVRAKVQHHYLPVFETYGMTETISHIALKDLRTNDEFFTAMKGVELGVDEQSCLKIKAPSTLNQWIITNDVVELLSKNTFLLKGRRDNIINSGGIKIQLEEVDRSMASQLSNSPLFFSYGIPHDTLGTQLVVVVEGNSFDFDQATASLPKYHKPKQVFFVEQFERTESGKINKPKTVEKIIR